MRNMKFKIGEKIMITNQYFIDKKEIDMPLYGTICEIDEDSNHIRFENEKGSKWTINAWMCEKDTITTMKQKDTDTKEEKKIKSIIELIARKVASDNIDKLKEAEEFLDSYLYCEDDKNQRMINELNVRRGLYKYIELATMKMEKEKEQDEERYEFRQIILECKKSEVLHALNVFGIFTEFELEKQEMKELEKASLKKESQTTITKKDDSIGDIFSQVVALKALESMLGYNSNDEENDDFKDDDYDAEKDDAKNDSFKLPSLFDNANNTQNKKAKKKDLPDCLIDMTELARKGRYNSIIGREDEIDTVSETLARKEIRNPLLIGKPGAGKTAVVEELVKRAYEGKIEHLKNKQFYELRMNDLVAGTMYRGQLEQKLKDVMKVLEDDPDVILFIDEVHMIVQAGSTAEDKNDVANALKPYLTSEISIIGATTFDEYKCTFENDGALARRFNPIVIEEKTKDEVIDIICNVKERFESYHGVELSEKMVTDIVNEIYGSKLDNSLIASALTAVDTICTKMKIKHLTEKEAFSRWSNEVVLSVDRTNKGGKTGKIGFSFDETEEEIVKEHVEEIKTDDKNIIEKDDLDEIIDAIEDLDNTYVEEKDNENDASIWTIHIPTPEEYIKLTGDNLLEHYDEYIINLLELTDEYEEDELDDEDDSSL